MKKHLLLILLGFTIFTAAQDDTKIIDPPNSPVIQLIDSERTNMKFIRVYCIANYVFIENRLGDDRSLTQLMRQSPEKNNKSHTTPMTCIEYMKTRKKVRESK